MAFLKPLLTMAYFGSNCCFLNFLAHDLTPYQMDKEGKVSIKIQQIYKLFSLMGDEVNIQKNCVLRPAVVDIRECESANVEKRKEEQIFQS